jgi:hypothetical protein
MTQKTTFAAVIIITVLHIHAVNESTSGVLHLRTYVMYYYEYYANISTLVIINTITTTTTTTIIIIGKTTLFAHSLP